MRKITKNVVWIIFFLVLNCCLDVLETFVLIKFFHNNTFFTNEAVLYVTVLIAFPAIVLILSVYIIVGCQKEITTELHNRQKCELFHQVEMEAKIVVIDGVKIIFLFDDNYTIQYYIYKHKYHTGDVVALKCFERLDSDGNLIDRWLEEDTVLDFTLC